MRKINWHRLHFGLLFLRLGRNHDATLVGHLKRHRAICNQSWPLVRNKGKRKDQMQRTP